MSCIVTVGTRSQESLGETRRSDSSGTWVGGEAVEGGTVKGVSWLVTTLIKHTDKQSHERITLRDLTYETLSSLKRYKW